MKDRDIMKKSYYILSIISAILLLSTSANPPQGNSGAPFDSTCANSNCHSSSSSIDGSIEIIGVPDAIEAGQRYPFTIVINSTSGSPTRAGFQMVAVGDDESDSGSIENPGTGSTTSSHKNRTYFEHQPAKNFGGSNRIEYTADWTAPQGSGGEETTFYISAMIVNGNGGTSGDTYKRINKTVRLKSQAGSLQASMTDFSDPLCNGDANGTATVFASGGSENYAYNWSNGESSAKAVRLTAGDHTVIVSDGTDEETLSISLEEPILLEAIIQQTNNVECGDGNDGGLDVTATGGTGEYTIAWSNGQFGEEIINLSPGLYSLTVTDDNGCTGEASVTLFAQDMQPPSFTAVDALEFSFEEGASVISFDNLNEIVLSSSDNCTSELSFDWSPKEFTCDDIGTTELIITVSDQAGNQSAKVIPVQIMDNVAPIITCPAEILSLGSCAPFSYTMPSVSDNCSGVRLELTSGIGSNGIFPEGETTDVYLATDLAGNTSSCQIVIQNEPVISAQIKTTDISCNGEIDGAVEIMVDGTNGSFEISISGSDGIINLPKGMYEVLITDLTGCTTTVQFEINEPDLLEISNTELIKPATSNSGDGSIDLTITGGTEPYMYSWKVEDEFFSDSEDLTLLFPGNYNVEVTDARGCSVVSEVYVLDATTSVNDPEISSKVITYPNPMSDVLNLEIRDLIYNQGRIELYTISGKNVMSYNLQAIRNDKIKVDFLEEGVYFLKVNLDKEVVTRRLIKL